MNKKILLILGILSLILISGCSPPVERCVELCLKQDSVVDSFKDNTCLCVEKEVEAKDFQQDVEGLLFTTGEITFESEILADTKYKIDIDCGWVSENYNNSTDYFAKEIIDIIDLCRIIYPDLYEKEIQPILGNDLLCKEGEISREITCECAKNTKTPCMAYCFVCEENG